MTTTPEDEPVVIGLTQYQAQLIASARRAILAKFSNDGLTPTALKALLADLYAAATGEVVVATELLPKLGDPDAARETISVSRAARLIGISDRAVVAALHGDRLVGQQRSHHARWLVDADSALTYALRQVI